MLLFLTLIHLFIRQQAFAGYLPHATIVPGVRDKKVNGHEISWKHIFKGKDGFRIILLHGEIQIEIKYFIRPRHIREYLKDR